MKSDKPLQAAVFLDTRPGHRKQTQGILGSLEQLIVINTVRFELPHLPVTGEMLKWLKYCLRPDLQCSFDLEGCDFIIGTGSRTHIQMLACKKRYNIPAITCMAPTALLRSKFDLCFVPRHDAIQVASNIMLTDGPPNQAKSRNMHDAGRGLILIGGKDEKSHRWSDEEVCSCVQLILEREKEIKWTISSSPRTPAGTNANLTKLAARFASASFISFSETGPGWIEKQYDENETVWVTADSVSMIFEARSAGCQVGVLPVDWKKKQNKFKRCVDGLSQKGQVILFDAWKNGKACHGVPEPLNEAQRCAREILKRWWPNRLL